MVVEIIRNTPSERSELPSLNDDGMQEANGKYECSPICVIDLIQEFLGDNCSKSLVETALRPFGGSFVTLMVF